MRALCKKGIMLVMTTPFSSSRVLLVPDRRSVPPVSDHAPVRRYRIARLRFDGAATVSRFDHLKRIYE